MARTALACLVLALLWASACSGPIVQLRPGAERVAILRLPPGAAHRAIGPLYCRLGRNARSLEVNARGCRTHLRNDAHERGADLVVLEVEEVGRYDCRNCVYLYGQMFVRR